MINNQKSTTLHTTVQGRDSTHWRWVVLGVEQSVLDDPQAVTQTYGWSIGSHRTGATAFFMSSSGCSTSPPFPNKMSTSI